MNKKHTFLVLFLVSLSLIFLYLVLAGSYTLYDNHDDISIDTNLWTTNGNLYVYAERNISGIGYMEISGDGNPARVGNISMKKNLANYTNLRISAKTGWDTDAGSVYNISFNVGNVQVYMMNPVRSIGTGSYITYLFNISGNNITVYNDTSMIVLSSKIIDQTQNFNFFMDTSNQGNGVAYFYINNTDAVLVDTMPPNINFINPTNITYNNQTMLINISSDSTNSSIWWYNGTDNLTYTDWLFYNFSEGQNTIISYSNDSLNNFNSTTLRFIIDTLIPNINFTPSTDSSNNYSRNWIFANVSASDLNLVNITINLYNSSGDLINNKTATYNNESYNFTSLSDGTYYINATATDGANNKNSTEIRTIILDTTIPKINIYFPQDTSTLVSNLSINLNFSVYDIRLDSCKYYINNLSGSPIINLTNLATCENITFNVTYDQIYKINFSANDTLNNINSKLITFTISSESPGFTDLYPSNNSYISTNYTDINFTATDKDGLGKCELWGDFSGNYSLNYTWNKPNNATMNFTRLSLSDRVYHWSINCSDSLGNSGFYFQNNTLTIDTIYPNTSISTTSSGTSVYIANNISDTNLDRCRYNIFDSSVSLLANATFTCGSTINTVLAVANNYNITIWAWDKAENWAYSSQVYNVTSSGGTGGSPSGGGGSSANKNNEGATWTMEVASGIGKYEVNVAIGTARDLSIDFENTGTSSRTITLSCKDTQGNLCKYVTFKEASFILPLIKDTKTKEFFTINIPKDFEEGLYKFNIIATDDLGNIGAISVDVNTQLNSISQLFTKLTSSNSIGFPYFLIFIISLIICIVIFSFIFRNAPLRALWVILLSFGISIYIITIF